MLYDIRYTTSVGRTDGQAGGRMGERSEKSNQAHQAYTEMGAGAAKAAPPPLFGYVRDVIDFILIFYLILSERHLRWFALRAVSYH